MHPTLAHGRRLALHLSVWTIVGALFSAVLTGQAPLSPSQSLSVALPLAIVYGFFCLSSWYVARSMPLAATGVVRIAITSLTAAAISGAGWLALARVWMEVLSRRGAAFDAPAVFEATDRLFFGFGLLLYLFSLAVGYVEASYEQSREAERRGFEGRVLAREAELRSLRAQIDPHFLFNSLHSISALTSADPAAARRMCVLLADFLRESLALGAEDRITLGRELRLAARFLDIEAVRFGARLRVAIDPGEAEPCLVPPLLLQPIVENAVTHGIAHVLEGGAVTISASRTAATVTIVVSNPCDPDRPRRTGTGVGLANVRARLRALHGDDARLSVSEAGGSCRVEIAIPAELAQAPGDQVTAMADDSLRVVIVDDEPLARAVVREYLAAHPGVEIVAQCANGFEAVKAVTELAPDLMFLDVQMPKLSGFEVLELVGRQVPVIFTTAYDKYALRAFEVHAVDYLLKPFTAERFAEALSRARTRLQAPAADTVETLVSAARPRQGPLERVLIRDGSQVHVLPVERIDYVEAQDDYVAFKSEGKQYLKDQTMASIEAALDPARFVRIHRSYLLNIERIARVELYAKDSRVAILRDGTRLPVSRAGYARLAKLL